MGCLSATAPFKDCSFNTVALPAGLKWIGDNARICIVNEQAEIVIPDGVTHIGTYAINGYYVGLTIILPASVTSIEEDAFINESITIIAPKGSCAESYALEHNYLFKEK